MPLIDASTSPAKDALAFALKERAQCLSDREWRHRLRGYGYDVRQTAEGPVLTLLTTGATLGKLGDA